MTNFWKSFSFRTTQNHVERYQAVLDEWGALSVTLEDAEDQPLLEPLPGETPIWDQLVITALFSQSFDEAQMVIYLEKNHLPYHFKLVEDQPWETVWQKDFVPTLFAEKLWVIPSWCSERPTYQPFILMDPGLAFGSGSHPTTALCLEWLARIGSMENQQVLDFGCGSGILAIAAAKLGARHVFGIDIDPQAILATQMNAQQNQVNTQITVGDIDLAVGQVDILIANILANPLKTLSSQFQSLLKPKGRIALSGVLLEQAPEVIAAYAPWITLKISQTRENWVLLCS